MRYVISNVSESNVKWIIRLMKERKVKVLVFMIYKSKWIYYNLFILNYIIIY